MDYIGWVNQFASGRCWFERLKAKKGTPDRVLYQYGISLNFFGILLSPS